MVLQEAQGGGGVFFGCTYTLICVIQVTYSDYLTRVLAKIKHIAIRVSKPRSLGRVFGIHEP